MAKYATYNFELYQGADEIFPVSFFSTEGSEKTAIVLDDTSEYIMTIQDDAGIIHDTLTYSDKRIQLGIMSNNEFVEETENANTLLLTFPHQITEKLILPRYKYDLFQVHLDNTRSILLHGKIIMYKSVSYD